MAESEVKMKISFLWFIHINSHDVFLSVHSIHSVCGAIRTKERKFISIGIWMKKILKITYGWSFHTIQHKWHYKSEWKLPIVAASSSCHCCDIKIELAKAWHIFSHLLFISLAHSIEKVRKKAIFILLSRRVRDDA